MADKDDKDKDTTPASEDVVKKYKIAAEIANSVLKQVIEKCNTDESVSKLCDFSDKLIITETGQALPKEKDLKKGVAFPTCISVNNCICHFSPLKSEPDCLLKDGDVVKIDMGAHIDGFIAVVAHTLVVGATKDNKVLGRKADVIKAAHYACEAALRLVVPGNYNTGVTDAIQKVAESFKCKPIEGMLSHQLKHFKIDGEKTIIQNPSEAQKKDHERCEFETYDVFAIDILISTGEGKGREMDTRTTVFKKTNEVYLLKLKASRVFLGEVNKKFGNLPFTLRAFDEEKKARMGVLECVKHKVLEPFGVLFEKEGEYVAQFKFTILLQPSGSEKITGLPFDEELYESQNTIDEESLQQILNSAVEKQGDKKPKKKVDKVVLNKEVALNDNVKAED